MAESAAGRLRSGLWRIGAVWLTAGYIHLLLVLRVKEWIGYPLAYLLFIPVVWMEWTSSRRFRFGAAVPWRETPIRFRIGATARIFLWFLFFNFWVAFVAMRSAEEQWMRWFAVDFPLQYYLVIRAEGVIALGAFLFWITALYVVTLRWGRLPIFTAMLLPNLLMLALFYHLYHMGGRGEMTPVPDLLAQPGVRRALTVETPGDDRLRHPRGICLDANQEAVHVMFGCTACPRNIRYTTIVSRHPRYGGVRYFTSGNIRRVHCDPASDFLYVAPWYESVFYKVRKRDLGAARSYPVQIEGILPYWEPMDIVKDRLRERVYIGNNVIQALAAYDLETGRLTGVRNLLADGLVKEGGCLWNIIHDPGRDLLYCIAGPGPYNLFAIDPLTLNIVRKTGFVDVMPTALTLAPAGDRLYCQKGAFDALLEIDADTLEVRRTLPGEIHARHLRVDPGRNTVYVLGYLSGTLFAIDLQTGRRTWSRKVGGLPHGMAPEYDRSGRMVRLWINSRAGVLTVDLPEQPPKAIP